MFRKATDGAGAPTFILLCENQRCALVARMEIPEGEIEKDEKTPFLHGVRGHGWTLSLEAHLCPKHSQANAAAKSLIAVVKTLPGIRN
jgi:hypothetical protein